MAEASIDSLAALLRYCEDFARRMLADSGAFYPFGAFINADGQLEALGGHAGVERPDPQKIYQFLYGAIAKLAADGKLVSYALAANVDIPSGFDTPFRDGIRVHVEAPGISRFVYTPYRRLPYRAVRKFLAVVPVVEYGETIAVDIDAQVFAA